MATTKEFHDYIMENLQRVGNISTLRMMGEYCVYYKDKIIGNICDNCLYLKCTPSSERLLPDAETGYPYKGSRTLMLMIDDVENEELMSEVIRYMYDELPEPKEKKSGKG